MRASAPPHCPASRPRAGAYSASRRILRAIVSPGTCSTTIHESPSPLPGTSAPVTTTCGTGTPSARAARNSATSVAMPVRRTPDGRSRWRIRGRSPAANAHVSRLAPPESRRSPVTGPAPTTAPSAAAQVGRARARTAGHSIGTRGTPSSSSWWRYSLIP